MAPADTLSQSPCPDTEAPTDNTVPVECGSATGVLYIMPQATEVASSAFYLTHYGILPRSSRVLVVRIGQRIGGNLFIMRAPMYPWALS